MSDFGLDATGLKDAIRDFWENNPVIQAVQPVQSGPATTAPSPPRLSFILLLSRST